MNYVKYYLGPFITFFLILQIVHYIRENLDNHEIEAADPGQQLQEAATEEVDIFTSLSLPHLMFALLDR